MPADDPDADTGSADADVRAAEVQAGEVQSPDAGTGYDPSAARRDDPAALIAAVDGLGALSDQPVHAHAARYHDVHTVLQDALTDTDRPGA